MALGYLPNKMCRIGKMGKWEKGRIVCLCVRRQSFDSFEMNRLTGTVSLTQRENHW